MLTPIDALNKLTQHRPSLFEEDWFYSLRADGKAFQILPHFGNLNVWELRRLEGTGIEQLGLFDSAETAAVFLQGYLYRD